MIDSFDLADDPFDGDTDQGYAGTTFDPYAYDLPGADPYAWPTDSPGVAPYWPLNPDDPMDQEVIDTLEWVDSVDLENPYSFGPEFQPGIEHRLIGDPEADMQHWHMQSTDYSCAVVSQEFILDELTGRDFTEAELLQQAWSHGLVSENGTPMNVIGELLRMNGLEIDRMYDATIEDLAERLDRGEKIIVGVDSGEIWNPGSQPFLSYVLEDILGMPGQDADHAVQVIGIDNSDPVNPEVILNDPGTPDGQGLRVPLKRFLESWEDSGNFMVAARPPAT